RLVLAGDRGAADMTVAETGAVLPRAEPRTDSHPTGWWGMVFLIVTEASLFVLLIFSYFYLRWESPRWPPEGIALPSFTTIIPATVLLLGSSAPVVWGELGIRHDDQRQLRLGFLVAWLMAAGFMLLELWEWKQLGYGPQQNAYTSLFFTITGLHLAHLSVALGLSVYVQLRAWLGHFDSRHFLAVENVSLYWHFVDAVWIAVFATLYISPYVR
ncbi:MAG: cytochrome c oxidase subunit 3, partial [Dehalococcoidia bacterium]